MLSLLVVALVLGGLLGLCWLILRSVRMGSVRIDIAPDERADGDSADGRH